MRSIKGKVWQTIFIGRALARRSAEEVMLGCIGMIALVVIWAYSTAGVLFFSSFSPMPEIQSNLDTGQSARALSFDENGVPFSIRW